jgi:hypothetical protein
MNAVEFEQKQEAKLQDVPKEFHSPLRMIAWDRGHSSGHSEVLMILEDLVFHFKPAIDEYTKNLQNKEQAS